MANRLGREKSPYLLQHRENPVDWYPWCDEAFQKAAQEDKPILLSIGYSTCHWCHVMAHESFEDPEVARLLNRDFISIKVDREERPDVDAVYMSVCQAVTGSGGWPLTIFMTPEQRPFFAGTYFPKNQTYGQPGFTDLLERVAYLWKNDRETLLHTGNQITDAINRQEALGDAVPDKLLLRRAYRQFTRLFDSQWGGFGSAPKFPTPHNLLFLMRFGQAEDKAEAQTMVETTLDAMASGGIQDHIGGGFSRYSTDEMWLVPHFEKMLYDNALLLLTYTRAWQRTKKEPYADTARRTADYILRELADPEGGFFCGQDADSEGIEGKYYVFAPEEVQQVLGDPDGAEFCRLYNITEEGNFEGKSMPNRIGIREPGWASEDPRLQKLYAYRLNRTRLHKDDKILLSWNAWTMIALARAGQILEHPKYLDAAIRARNFIRQNMTDSRDRLRLRYRDGEAAFDGQLEDYAVYGLALLALYNATFETEYLQEAICRARQMIALFEDRESGGFFMTASDSERLIARPKETYDGAIPSGNTAAALLLQRLALLTADADLQASAKKQLRFLAGAISRYPSGSCVGLLAMMDGLYPHRELVCATRSGIPDDLVNHLRTHPAEDLHILLKTADNADTLAQCAAFTKDYPIPLDGAVYYLCKNGACSAPVTDFSQLSL